MSKNTPAKVVADAITSLHDKVNNFRGDLTKIDIGPWHESTKHDNKVRRRYQFEAEAESAARMAAKDYKVWLDVAKTLRNDTRQKHLRRFDPARVTMIRDEVTAALKATTNMAQGDGHGARIAAFRERFDGDAEALHALRLAAAPYVDNTDLTLAEGTDAETLREMRTRLNADKLEDDAPVVEAEAQFKEVEALWPALHAAIKRAQDEAELSPPQDMFKERGPWEVEFLGLQRYEGFDVDAVVDQMNAKAQGNPLTVGGNGATVDASQGAV